MIKKLLSYILGFVFAFKDFLLNFYDFLARFWHAFYNVNYSLYTDIKHMALVHKVVYIVAQVVFFTYAILGMNGFNVHPLATRLMFVLVIIIQWVCLGNGAYRRKQFEYTVARLSKIYDEQLAEKGTSVRDMLEGKQ